jgi:tetratricopeptide (TPR) repeat protein
MKKYAILLSLFFVFSLTQAQTGKRNSAFNFMKSGNLPKAKVAIDAAIEHSKTKDDAKTWLYRGEIYIEIAKSPLGDLVGIGAGEAAKIGYEALLKAKELDVDGDFKEDLAIYLGMSSEVYFNLAVSKYNEKIYDEAGDLFNESFDIANSTGRFDTTALFNGAMAFDKAKVYDKAGINYGKLADMNYDNSMVYYSYTNILKMEGDTIKAAAIVDKGRNMFPKDVNLILAETNIFLESKQTDKALANLKFMLSIDSSNFSVYHAVGAMFDVIFNNEEYTDEQRLEAFDESEASYLRAIELKADFFESIYNLGALYFNKGVFYLGKADALPFGDKGYEPLKEKGDGFLVTALPYLEKALELKGDDYNTLFSLKQIYSRTGESEKYKVVNDKLAEIGVPEE